AEKGMGAWLNESRLRVSGRNRMFEGTFATGIQFGTRPDLPETLQDLARLMPVCAGVRRWGAAALDLAYVAAGRFDGYWERGLHAWDIAAGLVILRDAGGLVEPLVAGDNMLDTGDIVAGNEAIFDKFAKVIRG
ncbi:MAG: inositol monophosphatase family protein, partial [Maritimibacter sp.]